MAHGSKLALTALTSFVCLFIAPACGSDGATSDNAGGSATSGGSGSGGTQSSSGGSGGASSSGGSQSSSGGSSGASSSGGTQSGSGGSGGSQSSGGSGNAGTANGGGGGTIPPPNGTEANLRVLNWNGHQAAATFTFDDADPTHYNVAAPVLNERGVKATFFVVQDTIEAYGDVSRNGFAALRDAGHELANHTKTHTGSSAGTASEVTSCDTYLKQQFGITPSTFAYPNVDITATYKDAAAALYVASRGGGDGAHILPNSTPDWHNLPSFFISDPENDQGYLNHPDQAMAAFDATLAAGGWRIITVHGVGSGGFWAPTSPSNLAAVIDHLDGKDFWIDTFARVAGYLRAQQALEAATPVQDGTSLTWSWTLPPGFPSDVRLRVLVDGGTLTQGGTPVVWNGAEGYYPVDPQALSLTWTP